MVLATLQRVLTSCWGPTPADRCTAVHARFKATPQVGRRMRAYRVEGTFPNGRQKQPFTLDVVAADEAGARERVLSLLGSRHRVRRGQVTIAGIGSIRPGQSGDPHIRSHFSDE